MLVGAWTANRHQHTHTPRYTTIPTTHCVRHICIGHSTRRNSCVCPPAIWHTHMTFINLAIIDCCYQFGWKKGNICYFCFVVKRWTVVESAVAGAVLALTPPPLTLTHTLALYSVSASSHIFGWHVNSVLFLFAHFSLSPSLSLALSSLGVWFKRKKQCMNEKWMGMTFPIVCFQLCRSIQCFNHLFTVRLAADNNNVILFQMTNGSDENQLIFTWRPCFCETLPFRNHIQQLAIVLATNVNGLKSCMPRWLLIDAHRDNRRWLVIEHLAILSSSSSSSLWAFACGWRRFFFFILFVDVPAF